MNATLLVLLSLSAPAGPTEATSVAGCVEYALAEPALFTRRLYTCASDLSPESLIDGASYEHERPEVTERVRLILWNGLLHSRNEPSSSKHVARRLEAIELYAPGARQESLLSSFQDTGLLVARAKKKPDAFGRLCAVAAVGKGATDPVVIELVWNAWLDAPEFEIQWVMADSAALERRFRTHLQAVRKKNRAPRQEDFELARRFEGGWVWDELLFWSASADEAAARGATAALAQETYFHRAPVPESRRADVRAALLTQARKSNDEVGIAALGAWSRLAERHPPRVDLDVALELARANPLARNALVPILAAYAAEEPVVRPLLFAAVTDKNSSIFVRRQMIDSPGVACWLPAELLFRLRALTSPEAPEWYPTVGLANDLVERVWSRRIDALPGDEGGGSDYCSTYIGGPSDQEADARLFGIEKKQFDLLVPGMGSVQPSPDRQKWKAERAKQVAEERKAQLSVRDKLVAFLSNPPPLPAIHDCGRDKAPSAHLAQTPSGKAPSLFLTAGMSLTMTGTTSDWVLEAPDGGVAARGALGAKPFPGMTGIMARALPVTVRVDDWYRGPGTYTLSFPEASGKIRMAPWSFPVDAVDGSLHIGVNPARAGPTRHGFFRQRPAVEQVSVTLDWNEKRAVVRIANRSSDTLLPAGESWRDAVRIIRDEKAPTMRYSNHPDDDELAPGAEMEIELSAEELVRTGNLVATVAYVPAVADLPEKLVWVARSNSVRRHLFQPRPVRASRSEACVAGNAPWFPAAIEDQGSIVLPFRSTLLRKSGDGDSTLLEAKAPLRGVASDAKRWVAWGDRQIFVSGNAGETFDNVPVPAETDLVAVVPMAQGIAAFASDGRAWRQESARWVPLGLEPAKWHAVDSNEGLAAALDDCGRVFVSVDAGVGWKRVATPDGPFNDLRVADGRLWLAGEKGFFASDDAGSTWSAWFEGEACPGISTQGPLLVVQCGSRLMTRLGEGLVFGAPKPMPMGSRLIFGEEGHLVTAFGGFLFRWVDGMPQPLQ